MNIVDCARLLLGHFPFEEREIPDNATYPGRNAAVMAAMNQALEECHSQSSPWVRESQIGELTRPNATITVSVTQDSRNITVSSGWQSWMAGCGVVIDGHDIDNQFRDTTSSNTLKFPYGGTSGSKQAVVYHDCITLADEVLQVIAPLRFNGRPVPALVSGGIISNPARLDDYGRHRLVDVTQQTTTPLRLADLAGRVHAFSVETYATAASVISANRIRLHGPPAASGTIEFKTKLKPPAITDIAATTAVPIPHDFVASVFLPIARQKLTASPFFRDQAGKEEIAAASKAAMDTLASINPKPASRFRFEPA